MTKTTRYPDRKMTLIGGGIAAYWAVYLAYKQALAQGEQLRATIHEKNPTNQNEASFHDTTTMHLVPSLTIDEIVAVVPPASVLAEKAQIAFNAGGIRVDDVPAIPAADAYATFMQGVRQFGASGEAERRKTLLELGLMSMQLWQTLCDDDDEELQQLLKAANFNPCREPLDPENPVLHDGYRIDLLYKDPQATAKAEDMKKDYEQFGYQNCRLLSPAEVLMRDPSLADFCAQNTRITETGECIWNNAQAIWRPGGCINTRVFLPRFHDYLVKKMGTYVNDQGLIKPCFRVHTERNVIGLTYAADAAATVDGLQFAAYVKTADQVKRNKHPYARSEYLLCPGEQVGTLDQLGLIEPAYARFAGASLLLSIDATDLSDDELQTLNHCMEVHQPSAVLAWQARICDGKLFIGTAGTKAFYADVAPQVNEAFAKDRNLLQLNTINEVLPKVVSKALGRNTRGETLQQADLDQLEQAGIAIRWVGSRAVAADGFPTDGWVYKKDGTRVDNMVTNTHLGSGGVSFAPATSACALSRLGLFTPKPQHAELVERTLVLASSTRMEAK